MQRFGGRSFVFITGVLVFLAPGPSAAAAADQPETCRRLALVLLDGTGSFTRDLPAAIREAKRVLVKLEAGDCFLARAIREQSYGTRNDLVPLLRLPLPRRTIDVAGRRQLLAGKQAAAASLDELLKAPPARATDIWQALHAAALTFRTVEARGKELYVFSDLEDNRRLKSDRLRLDLGGVRVRMVAPRGNRDTAESFEGRLKAWRGIFEAAGAREVRFEELAGGPRVTAGNGRSL